MQLHDDEDTNGMVYNSEGKRAENVASKILFVDVLLYGSTSKQLI